MIGAELIKEAELIVRQYNIYWVLADRQPVPCHDADKWTQWMEETNRSVAMTLTWNGRVSTSFLGVNIGMSIRGLPLLFETIVVGGSFNGCLKRYSTWRDAMVGHTQVVKHVMTSGGGGK